MILKAGTYRFNDVLTNPTENVELAIDYTFDGVECSKLVYGVVNEQVILQVFIGEQGIALYVGSWQDLTGLNITDDEIRLFTFTADTEVNDTFGTWYIANTNYNEVNGIVETKPLAEITYNGETIAQLNAGETCTLKCAGLPMETDIIVKVNG